MWVLDLVAEALAGALQRPGRSLLTMLGTVLGVGAFVATLGLTATAGGQIDKRFTALSATEVNVADVGDPGADVMHASFPADASARVRALNGVVQAGVLWELPGTQARISAHPQAQGADGMSSGVGWFAAEPGALAAMHPTVAQGRLYDAFHESRGEQVAVLGAAAATRLGISRLDGNPAVFIDNVPFTVIGIIDHLDRRGEHIASVLIPATTARRLYGEPIQPRASMLVETRLGAAQLIVRQAPLALRAEAPQLFAATAAADPTQLRGSVGRDLDSLFLLLAGISLVIGAVGIANTTLVAVLERTSEIGLRRSLGALRRHIAGQFLTESTVLGTMGGLIGTSLGVSMVVLVSITKQWTAIVHPWSVLLAPLVGSAVGLLAGVYPAARAAWVEPVEALRR